MVLREPCAITSPALEPGFGITPPRIPDVAQRLLSTWFFSFSSLAYGAFFEFIVDISKQNR